MKSRSDILEMVEVCKMYYEQELTQVEIAKRMQLSRLTISKMLKRAKEYGIVKIEVLSPMENVNVVLNQLKSIFHIQGGLVIPTQSRDENFIEDLVLSQAAMYLENLLPDIQTIGLGWGYAVGRFIENIRSRHTLDGFTGKVFPLIGSSTNPSKWYQPNELVRMLGERIGYEPFYLPAPAFPLSQKNNALFTGTTEYQEMLKLWANTDVAIFGIDSYPSMPDQATAVRFGDLLDEKNAVGTVLTYFYDRNGAIITCEDDIVIRIPLALLQSVKKGIGIVTGLNRIDTIYGALQTGLITHVITDEITAREIIASART